MIFTRRYPAVVRARARKRSRPLNEQPFGLAAAHQRIRDGTRLPTEGERDTMYVFFFVVCR